MYHTLISTLYLPPLLGVAVLCQSLSTMTALRCLNLSNNMIEDAGASCLADTITTMTTTSTSITTTIENGNNDTSNNDDSRNRNNQNFNNNSSKNGNNIMSSDEIVVHSSSSSKTALKLLLSNNRIDITGALSLVRVAMQTQRNTPMYIHYKPPVSPASGLLSLPSTVYFLEYLR